jgi:anti-sigma regulatory factor (Ser/Thr protein kinase)
MPGLTVQLASKEQAAHEARELIRKCFGDLIPATTLWDVLTVVTELVTNAVRHGQSDTVRVSLGVAADGKITGAVENDGRGRVEPLFIEPRDTSGLGLHIVGAIAERWWVHVNGSTLVRFELPRA